MASQNFLGNPWYKTMEFNDHWNLRNFMFSSHVTPYLQHTFQFPFFANQNYILAEQTPTYKKSIELVDELVVRY